jgi:kynurenine formamidase
MLIAWAEKGIVGRGVLIDFASWAKSRGRQVHTFQQYVITLEDVQAFVREKNIIFHRGDILFIRTGFVTAYKGIDHEGRSEVATKKEWIGLGQSQKATEWLWENQFAAVASDSPGFECRRKSNVLKRKKQQVHNDDLTRNV